MRVRMDQVFKIKSGDYHAVSELDYGQIPLVSCGEVNHGFIGRFDIPIEHRYSNAVTVAYNGKPLTAKYRPYEFGAKDDVGVCLPHKPLSDLALVYLAALLNSMRWRFSYGRKCFRNKLSQMEIDIPAVRQGGHIRIDESHIAKLAHVQNLDMRPVSEEHENQKKIAPILKWETRRLDELFLLQRGDFHSLKDLRTGTYATVSRTERDNGVVGYFERPEGSMQFQPGLITVSTVSGDAFVQVTEFIATDNVIVCIPRNGKRITTACFMAAMINNQKWRYSYGRQCYKEKLSALSIQVPMRDGHIDEAAIETIVERQPYWPYVRTRAATEARNLRGIGWEGDLDVMRSSSSP